MQTIETIENSQTIQTADERTRPLEAGEWFGYMFLCLIPAVNIIALIIWAVSSKGNLNRRNWARAYLGITAIVIVVCVFIVLVAAGSHT